MKNFSYLCAALFAVLLTVVPAMLAGKHVQRWGVTPELTAAAARLPRFPKQFGDWEFIADGPPLSESVCTELGLAAHITRSYRNKVTGEEIGLLLMVGQPGPLVRHPPDICYANRANEFLGESMYSTGSSPGSGSTFKVLKYERANTLPPVAFRVAYSHTIDGVWDAPDSPRLKYGGEALVYKMQALTSASSDDVASDPLLQFLDEYVLCFRAVQGK